MGVYDERRVKIVATLGPASRERDTLREMFLAGLDVVRINAAHGSPDERSRLVQDVREVSDELGRLVPILFDLRGLKIRTGPLAGDEKVGFARGSRVEVTNTPVPTTPERIGIDYKPLFDVVEPGSRILISDGLIELLVEKVEGDTAIGLMAHDLPPAVSPPQAAAVMEPRLVELCFQTAGLWEIVHDRRLALPSALGALRVRRHVGNGERLWAQVRREPDGAFSARVVDDLGEVFVELDGYRTVPFEENRALGA